MRAPSFVVCAVAVVLSVQVLATAAAMAQGTGGAGGGSGRPMAVSLAACRPAGLGTIAEVGQPYLQPGNVGVGFLNSTSTRTFRVEVVYHHDSTDVASAIDKIDKIQLCYIRADSSQACPPTWVLYEKNVTPPIPTTQVASCTVSGSPPVATCNKTRPALVRELPAIADFDWGDTALGSESRGLFVSVTSNPQIVPLDPASQLQEHGGCINPSIRATAPAGQPSRVQVITPKTDFSALACVGTRVVDVGTPAVPRQGCLKNDAEADYIRRVAERAIDNQAALQANPAEVARFSSWQNGNAGGQVLPIRMFIGPYGSTAPGQKAFSVDVLLFPLLNAGTDTPFPPAGWPARIPCTDCLTRLGNTSGLVPIPAITVHELLHELEWQWYLERPAFRPLRGGVVESLGRSLESTACLFGYPNDTSGGCTSTGKIMRTMDLTTPTGVQTDFGGLRTTMSVIAPSILGVPERDTVTTLYSSGIWWNYVYQQFAYSRVPENLAHPAFQPVVFVGQTRVATTDSSIQREPNADVLPPSARPRSDQGHDFVGLLLEELSRDTATPRSNSAAWDAAFKRHLGRTYSDTLFDFHTAFYLKDYGNVAPEPDPRWRFDWAHQDGYTAITTPSTLWPISVPTSNLFGRTTDSLIRARRLLDRGQDIRTTCPGALSPSRSACKPAPVPLALNQGQGLSTISLGPSGTTALSVQPGAGWAGRSLVVAGTHLLGAAPRLRLFRVDGGTPTSMCGSRPNFQCQSGVRTLFGTVLGISILGFNRNFTMSVPILPTTTEVLLVASNSSSDGISLFSAGFGTGQTGGLIIPRAPPRVFPRFPPRPSPFLLRVGQRLTTNTGVQLPPSSITVRVLNCAKSAQGPAACILPASSIQHLPISGGLNGLAVTVPADFFPAVPAGGSGSLAVQIDCTNLPSVSTTLEYSNRSPTQATALVLDRSAGMGAANVAAMKVATKALLQSLIPSAGSPPSDKVSLVAYADDADTLTGLAPVDVTFSSIAALRASIDGIAPGGGTSIGDGLFEAQSLLANSFDDLPAANRPDRQAIVIINGSLNSQGALPEIYVDGSATPPTGDGNGTWGPRALTWPARRTASLPTPDGIHTVGVGQFADFGRLGRLSRLTNTGALTLPLPGDSPIDQNALVRKFADVVTASYTNASTYGRVLGGDFSCSDTGAMTLPIPALGNDATELRVIVVGPNAGSRGFFLSGPAGNVQPISSSGDGVAFKVANPTGSWSVRLVSIEGSAETFFIEATVKSQGAELITQFDAADLPLSATGDPQAAPVGGSPLYLRAAPRDGQPALGCSVTARVADPDGMSGSAIPLLDDGQHQDGAANDGIYGSPFGRTSVPGTYAARINASCISPTTGAAFTRQGNVGVTVVPTPPGSDSDSDGMPDVWENAFGLNPQSAADAFQDADGDNLNNLSEFRAGTDPKESDSDGGGESDGSEVSAQRNPLAQDDDRVNRPVVMPEAGNGKVLLPAGMGLGMGTLIVERGPTDDGPWTRLQGVFQPGTYWAVDMNAPNGVQACYRLRAEATSPGVVSGWSAPRCVVPKTDVVPPTITQEGLSPCSGAGGLSIPFTMEDPPSTRDAPSGISVDLGTTSSGITEMRYWFGDAAEPPSTAAWGPVHNPLVVTPPDPVSGMLSVQVRDGVGNESAVTIVQFPLFGGCLTANAGSDQILQCSSAGRAMARFDATGSRDTNGGPLSFLWSAPGITFNTSTSSMPTASIPVGTTTATVAVTDVAGRKASDTVLATVIDTSPPVLIVPPDVTISNCQSPNIGAASATDACGGAVTLTNNKPSKFPLGTTVVTYWAVDQFGNAVSGTQRVSAVLGDNSSCCPSGTTIRMGTPNNDTLNGTSGSDCILGIGGQDTINGLGGNDYLAGGDGNDTIDGGPGADRVYGGNGQDQLRGGTGNDLVAGGDGDDICLGGDNDDTLEGGQGQDRLFGEGGSDQISGDDGDDRLEGGDANDALNGGGLHDVCVGGPGTDSFTLCEDTTP